MPQLFRIAVKMKETDKRKNAIVWRYVVMAETLDEAKALAMGARLSPEDSEYGSTRWEHVAHVWGHPMSTLAYGCDNYSEKDKTEHPDTVPPLAVVREAQRRLNRYEKEHEDPEDV